MIQTYKVPKTYDICLCPECNTVLQKSLELLTRKFEILSYRCPKCRSNIKAQDVIIYEQIKFR